MNNEALFRDKPVWKAIFSLAIPSVLTILVMIVYNMADLFFIGMLGDDTQVHSTFPGQLITERYRFACARYPAKFLFSLRIELVSDLL